MNRVVPWAFAFVGLLHAFPMLGALGESRLRALYGVTVGNADLELLLRHRAVLLGVVAGLAFAAAWRATLRPVAAAVALASMASFVLLALPLRAHGAALAPVFWSDVVALGLLVAVLPAVLRARASRAVP